ncbi:MAG: TetR/AcrR family transcriptional regulator [Sphingomonadales bacterium]|nr:MAG: TetR/AcrR family transcriptional regulator [Sphingomonadales bacterium]
MRHAVAMTQSAKTPPDGEKPVRMTQQERRARSQRRIISATLRTIAKQGVAGASLAEIGELAGYSRGLPAHLFGNKDKLLAESLRRLMVDYWIEDFPEINSRGAFATLAAAIGKWVHDLSAHNELSRAHLLLLQEANVGMAEQAYPELIPLIRQYVGGSEKRFRAYIAAGQEAGEIDPDLDPDFEALLIHTTLRGVSLRWLIEPSSIDIQKFADRFVERLSKQMLADPAGGEAMAAG